MLHNNVSALQQQEKPTGKQNLICLENTFSNRRYAQKH